MGFGDFFQGLGHGVMGMVGLGSLWSPMSKYQAELASAQSTLNTTVQQGTLKMMQVQSQWDAQLQGLLSVYADFYSEEFKFTQAVAQFASGENTTSILILAVLVIIIVTYLVLVPK